MELVAKSGLLASLDIAELNPALDADGRTARLIVALAATLLGRPVACFPPEKAIPCLQN
jgi:arginase